MAFSKDDEANSGDKAGYSFLNPVPDDKLREFETDRPGEALATTTVDAGRFQIESDIANYIRDPRNRMTTLSFAAPTLRVGITNSAEFQIGSTLFSRVRQGPTQDEPAMTAQGVGDTILGAKFNLFGNDGGDSSAALIPSLKVPTASPGVGNDHVEGIVSLPYKTALGKSELTFTVQPTFGILRNDDNNGYRQDYGLVGSLGVPLSKTVTAEIELATNVSSERYSPVKSTFDLAIQWKVTDNLQLDGAIYFGLNKATPRYNPYVGISYRF